MLKYCYTWLILLLLVGCTSLGKDLTLEQRAFELRKNYTVTVLDPVESYSLQPWCSDMGDVVMCAREDVVIKMSDYTEEAEKWLKLAESSARVGDATKYEHYANLTRAVMARITRELLEVKKHE